jgi:hypothetical protein
MPILKTMTIREAAAAWDDPRSALLETWAELFDVTLEGLRYSHILRYETERLAAKVPYAFIWPEVAALRALLKCVGLGEEIQSHYETPLEKVKLTEQELATLSARVRAYIAYLEQQVSGLNAENDRMKGTLRKINWGRRP